MYHHALACRCALIRTDLKVLGYVGLATHECDQHHMTQLTLPGH